MRKKLKKYILALACVLTISLFSINKVDAETGTLNVGKKLCYNYSGAYDGVSCYFNTYQKTIVDSSGVSHKAYCVQYGKMTPPNGVTINEVGYETIAGQNWTESKALIAGAIADDINSRNLSDESKTVYIHTALNTYLKFNSSRTYSNVIINEAISNAQNKVFYKTSNLTETKVKVNFVNPILNRGVKNGKSYYYSNVKIDIENNYPASVGEITYTPQCTNCKIYTDSSMKTEVTSIKVAAGSKKNLTYYVRSNDNLAGNSKINLTISASKNFTYSTAKLWYYSSYRQMLITTNPNTYTGKIRTTATATIPNTKQVFFYKTDPVGDELKGADIKVELTDNNGETIGSCTTNNKSQCSFTFTDNINTVDYKITEITSPIGYIKEATISNKWQVGANSSTCYRVNINDVDGAWGKLDDVTDCNTAYLKKEVCLDKNGSIVSNVEDSTTCLANNTPPTTDTEVDDKDNTIGDSGEGGEDSGLDGDLDNGTGENGGLESQDLTNEDGEDLPGEGNDEEPPKEEPEEIINNTWETKCLNDKNEIVDETKCNYDYALLTTTGDNLLLTMTNTLNYVKISKTDKDGKNVEGAGLKICSEETYKQKGNECEAYTTVSGTKLQWYTSLAVETFYGFKVGTYYLIEEKAPLGYKYDSTVIEFKIDEYGKIELAKDSKAKLEENTIIFKNELTSFSVSKQDMTTGKELKGATLSICAASNAENANGEYELTVSDAGFCEPVVLANGEFATWTSTDKPYIIKGLAAGAYYLVEKIAPTDYTTAESILFFIKDDGTITDKNGVSLKDSKLVMKDKLINGPKTSDIALVVVITFALVAIGLSSGSYFYLKKEKN